MKKILFTCFKPFGGRNINSSYEIIKQLNVNYQLVDVTYKEVQEFVNNIDDSYDYIILTGEAIKRDNLTIEQIAKNLVNGKDNDGVIKDNEQIVIGGIDLNTNFDIENDIEKSYDAGSYLCNYIYYKILNKFKNTNTKVTFIHFPNHEGKEQLLIKEMTELIMKL